MTDDDLRRQFEHLDPMGPRVSVDNAGSPHARILMEDIMSTPIDTEPSTGSQPSPVRRGRRRVALVAGGVVAAAAAIIAVAVVMRDDSAPASRQSFAIADAGTTMSSCVAFDPSFLAEMPVAFAATVTKITDTNVTLQVDHWYRSSTGDTDFVDLSLPAENTSAALDGVDFVTGQRYFVTATNGTVNGCGFSGPATPELQSAFDSAFPG